MRNTLTFLFFIGIAFFGFTALALASSPFDIIFPIAELDNCADKDACKAFCDDSANAQKCLAFAERHGITVRKNEEVHERAKLIRDQGGPGACQSERECRAFCENPAHEGECLEFARKHGFISEKKAKFAKKVMVEGGPGGCKGEEECRAFCENPDNFNECLAFAEKNELIGAEKAGRIRRLPPVGPGGCRGRECKDYCENPDHQEECIVFAEQNGLMSKEDAQRAKKFAGKPGPGGCRGEQCREFCHNPANEEACFQFAVENDLIPKEEMERIKKFKDAALQGGPGGCRGRACEDYCENPDHQEECFAFAKKNNLISEDELKMAERGRDLSRKVKEQGGPGGCKSDTECQAYCRNPENVEACLAFAVAHGGFKKEEAEHMLKEFVHEARRGRRGPEEFRPREDDDFDRFEDDRFERFEQFRVLEGQFRKPEGFEGGFSGGPGGCKGPEECIKFCSDPAHQSECGIFRGPDIRFDEQEHGELEEGRGIIRGVIEGPGGCKGPEECVRYCSDPLHRDECAKFNPSRGGPPPGDIFRRVRPGSESEFRPPREEGAGGSAAVCAGPKPLMPAPMGCAGPVCKEGRWEFECPEGERREPPSPDGLFKPGAFSPPSSGTPPFPSVGGTEARDGIVCTQEFHPVCGENKRTYPNGCYAKRDNVAVVKEGPCEPFGAGDPSGATVPLPDLNPSQPHTGFEPQPYPSPSLYPQKPPASSTSDFSGARKKGIWDFFLANLLEGFPVAFKFR